ncbi:MAG: OmpH family outer membrane protein [Candidatus Cloacimonetes bacterium]|nr:OmpH family outer membrane protein [Candidatus Cloacimonadota bacterium]
MKKFIIFLSFMVVFTISLTAQTLRIAYIDSYKIISESNDTREAQRIFQVDRDNWVSQIDDMEAEIVRLERELETRRLTLTESGRREAEERITTRMRERQQFIERVFGETGLAATRNNELMAPIMEKLRLAIDKIAVEENYSIIFDASSGVVWAQERLDITDQVINEMNR